MKIKVSSLGCRLNQSEIQSVITVLKERGHDITTGNEADVFIVNSCKVTLHSERKTRKLTYRALRACQDNPHARIFIAGCCADKPYHAGKLHYIPNDYKHLIPDIIDGKIGTGEIARCTPGRFNYPVPVKATTTRINLKIQDGCDNYCSYCIIPYTRGGPQNKPLSRVVSEFGKLLQAGYKEIVLTGVMIGKYRDSDHDLSDLVEKLLKTEGDFRLHLASLSPAHVTDKLVEQFGHEKTVKHLNLSLQSGSTAVLAKMNRHYTQDAYLDLVKKIRLVDRDFNLTTDVIVGFPQESDDDFQETLVVIRESGFSHIHTFRYSPRPGTAAAGYDNNVPEEVKRYRSREVIALYQQQKEAYYQKFHNRTSTLLSEKSFEGKTRGYNEYYIPVTMTECLERNRFYRIKTCSTPGHALMEGFLSEEQ